jgi:hypothetical protein
MPRALAPALGLALALATGVAAAQGSTTEQPTLSNPTPCVQAASISRSARRPASNARCADGTTSAMARQRDEVPQVAVGGLKPEREVQLPDRRGRVGDPAVPDDGVAHPGDVAPVARLEPTDDLVRGKPGQRGQRGDVLRVARLEPLDRVQRRQHVARPPGPQCHRVLLPAAFHRSLAVREVSRPTAPRVIGCKAERPGTFR